MVFMCCRCGVNPDKLQTGRSAYCKPCHAEAQRRWRAAHPLFEMDPVVRFKAMIRAYTHTYIRRGQIFRAPCCICGDEKAEVHHPDYTQPLHIIWLCRKCHLQAHRAGNDNDDLALKLLAEQWVAGRKRHGKHFKRLHWLTMQARKKAAEIRALEAANKRAA